jgi:hypothetical protein
MSSPVIYPHDVKEPYTTDVDGLDSDGEANSFTALIAEGEK